MRDVTFWVIPACWYRTTPPIRSATDMAGELTPARPPPRPPPVMPWRTWPQLPARASAECRATSAADRRAPTDNMIDAQRWRREEPKAMIFTSEVGMRKLQAPCSEEDPRCRKKGDSTLDATEARAWRSRSVGSNYLEKWNLLSQIFRTKQDLTTQNCST